MSNRRARFREDQRQKIQRARRRSRVRKWDYIVRQGGIRRGVACKVSGQLIRTLIDTGERTEDGYAIAVEEELPNYREIEITMTDGSKHITGVDDEILGRLNMGHIEDMYVSDVDRLADADNDDLLDIEALMDRVPKSFRIIPRR